jgi:hypothetical protein
MCMDGLFSDSFISADLCCSVLQGVDTRVVIEMFAEGGREFTAIVLDVGTGNVSRPVTLLPTEVKNHLISCEVSHMGTWA